MSSIYFGGSRSLSSPSRAVAQAVLAVLHSGGSVHVGCCVGADALVIQSALVAGFQSSLFVFSQCSASGAGAFSLSSAMPSVAASQGVSVQWLAGGELSVPLAGRLISRSLAALRGCSAAVFFSPGAGSLAVAAHAVAQSIPVYAFASSAPAQIPGCAGQWCPVFFHSLPCWLWQSAQLSLF